MTARDIELLEPYGVIDGITDVPQLEELRADIVTNQGLGAHKQFWDALYCVCDDEIAAQKLRNASLGSDSKTDSGAFLSNAGWGHVPSSVCALIPGESVSSVFLTWWVSICRFQRALNVDRFVTVDPRGRQFIISTHVPSRSFRFEAWH